MTSTQPNRTTIVLATNNPDKVREIRPLLMGIKPDVAVCSLKDLGVDLDIEETENTLEGNALLKAEAVFNHLSGRYPDLVSLADDTGLEVEALDGAPGVYSARFAPMPEGQLPAYEDNVRHLLKVMQHHSNRNATFRTVIAIKGRLNRPDGEHRFTSTVEGCVKGQITREKTGSNGFGYDPIFWVNSAQAAYAEMSTEEKNRLSHRSLAVRKAVETLRRELL
ncbi:RdgB/HAM1 family non-canonical purine NTP pyrophosphatase [Prosthecochloris sp. N3]|uniref:dITP/XTP pyrophosphatase n=1 Tax=Prosthecochloris ethylica TaxID=2743976 RepID=A0ABR9XUS3_9CHLB|nr:RdgB/HAM1 family non-canonical purine NTP pyrophosphatase [Prosthecochloris ethylica]MBF0587344.1 RdgB/HAM1 family non-canonical purine NTP pyrophosphatase [Prosthecochloris ethylica]MBF0637627.1 RdgB/HAM1 family non-canonical purine NTP pyrophosphatase [Prosthecochloris ethylica]NUK48258.1 RdgB/HAM1 family non-canonical purine NTP pyrophosphatase [Prosthecochloris ethylica]